MRISRQPSPVTIMTDQKQLENVEYFKYLGSILTNDGRCTCEIKSRIIIFIIGIQPLGRSGQRPEFSQATGMALVRCILGK